MGDVQVGDPGPVSVRPSETEGPSDYLSIRWNLGDDNFEVFQEKVLFDCEVYIAYRHNGKSGGNPHYHVCIPCESQKCGDKYRNRLKRQGWTGNGRFSIKFNSNGVHRFIQYASREGTSPEYKGVDQKFIDAAPQWVEQKKFQSTISTDRGAPRKKKSEDAFYSITYTNLLKVSVRYARNHALTSGKLEETIAHMTKNDWMFSNSVIVGGIPEFYFEQFTKMIKEGDRVGVSEGRILNMKKFCQYNH